jgi:hypothetical protein
MTPAWFQRAPRYLRPRWTAQHGIETPTHAPAGSEHAAHMVLARDGIGLDFCCAQHTEEFERNVARHGPPQRAIDALSGPERRYLTERLGGGPGVGPRR